jgi:hypothetical protein
VLVLGPEHIRTIAGDGWSNADAPRFLWENTHALGGERARIPCRYYFWRAEVAAVTRSTLTTSRTGAAPNDSA